MPFLPHSPFPPSPESIRAELHLPALPASVRHARRFTRDHLRGWGLDAEPVEVAELVVSELVTNAVEATRALRGDAARPGRLAGPVVLRLRLTREDLFVEVWDAAGKVPVPLCPGELTEGGRGLALVTALTKVWDHYPSALGGKVVWAQMPIPRSFGSEAGGDT